jgi:hypothetical protein
MKKSLRLLEVRQLVRSDQPLLDVVLGRLRRLAFHNIGDQANRLVRKGSDHMAVAVKLRHHSLHRECALRLREPKRGRLRPERRQLDLARLLRRRRRILLFFSRHVQS